MRKAMVAVFCVVVALLAVRAARLHIADTYLDPVGLVDAQDEAMYASSASHMASQGNWLTPIFQGRYALYRPPLLIWLAAASAKVLGASAFALRLPAILAGALTAVLVFLWGGRS